MLHPSGCDNTDYVVQSQKQTEIGVRMAFGLVCDEMCIIEKGNGPS